MSSSRDQDRLALAELNAGLARRRQELQALESGEAYPAMPADRRAQQIAELRHEVERREARVAELTPIVGDPDTVVADDGTTPPQRRVANLPLYIEWRRQRIAEREAEVAEQQAIVDDKSASREDRSKARTQLSLARSDLTWLSNQPTDEDLRPDDVCADGVHLVSSHGYTWSSSDPHWPCPAWPDWKARMQKVLTILLTASPAEPVAKPPTPEPTEQVLLRVKTGESAATAAELIAAAVADHPNAQVRTRRGAVEVFVSPQD